MYISRRRRAPGLYWKQKILVYVVIGAIGLTILGFIASLAIFAWYGRQLPSPGKLSQTSNYSTIFYDRDGKILYEMYKDKNRVPVPLGAISSYLKQATVAIEDKDFYKHKGFSQTGILRAVFSILFRHRIEGGSTITQQLIKNVLLTSEQSISRKVKEITLALAVENKYSKDQILEMYLNEAPYGGTYYGVGSAAMGYFGKNPKDLSLEESAILSGLPQNPPVYSPFIGVKDGWKNRARDVLRRMREDGYITSQREQEADKRLDSVKFASPQVAINAPQFVFYVKKWVEDQFGAKMIEQGVKIKTTLSLSAQQTAEKIVNTEIKNIKDDYQVGNGAAVVLDSQTGAVLAWVGSYDYNNKDYGKFDVVTSRSRQPGSTLKPFLYALAFEKGYTPATVIMDVKTTFAKQGDEDYTPENYDGKYRGPVQIRFALGNSINVPAVKMLAMLGIRDFLQKANDVGLTTLAPTEANVKRFGLSISLGGGEVRLLDLASAYSIFARGGMKKDIQTVISISDFNGKTLYQSPLSQATRVESPEVAFLISHILSDNNARLETFGPHSYLLIPGKTVAVKTGTTNDKRDNWAIGYTKGITTAVWVGNNDNQPMNPRIASGATGASPIWYNLMRKLLQTYPDGIMDKPDNVEAMTVDAYLGGLPKDGYPTRSEYFIKGTEPKDASPFYKKLKISKSTGKLANEVEIKSGNYEEKEYIVITENDPISTDGKNRWQEGIDAWAREQKDDKYHPPTELSNGSNESVIVSMTAPADHQHSDDNNVNVRAKIASVATVKTVKIYINGNEVKSWDEDKRDVDETFNLSQGSYEITVKAWNDKGQDGQGSVKIGVKQDWNSATPTPTNSP
ncbi:transglycosylase domain-containing protein [Patescibacteria group bacterium]|nr:transglycosylase domain-containing protein [Patescibacteria group bacterium]MCL5091875.1 transglycosylase domain-containing protein [Patescibacteria group bacterium]